MRNFVTHYSVVSEVTFFNSWYSYYYLEIATLIQLDHTVVRVRLEGNKCIYSSPFPIIYEMCY